MMATYEDTNGRKMALALNFSAQQLSVASGPENSSDDGDQWILPLHDNEKLPARLPLSGIFQHSDPR